MIRVQGPDGFSIEFPADTSQDVIRNVMSQRYGAPEAKQGPAMALPSDTSLAADPVRAQIDRERAETLFNNPALFEKQKAGIGRRILQGATMGFADEAIAAASTPLEMIRRGTLNPVKGYEFAKAQEDASLDEARDRQGILGAAAELGGGVMGGLGVAGGVQRAPEAASAAGRFAQTMLGGLRGPGNVASRIGAGIGSGAVYGGVAGVGEGSGLEDRLTKGAQGAAIGGALGGGLQGIAEVAKPTLGFVSASIDPRGFAQRQLARGISESGKDARDIVREVAEAQRAGQPFSVADAMGNAGQRQLSVVARNPGEGRTMAVDFLDGRQSGQAGRARDIIDDGLGVTQTGKSTSDELMQWARDASDPFYKKALAESPVWNERINQFLKDPISNQGLKRGLEIQRIESVARGEPFNPYDFVKVVKGDDGNEVMQAVPNMRTVNILKKGIDDIIEQYRDPTSGVLRLDERGRAINEFQRAFLKQIDDVNPSYAQARSLYAGPAQIKDRIYQGGVAATRGRASDNIGQFAKIADEAGQQGFRVGYADKLAGTMESGAEGVNAVRRLSSDKLKRELPAFALPEKRDGMVASLGREKTMFETRAQALGGSRTADNLSDNAAMGVSPEIISNLLSGNVLTAAKNAAVRSADTLSGNTAKVREELARYLLMTGNAQNLPADLAKAVARQIKRDELANRILRGAYAGTGSASSQSQARTK